MYYNDRDLELADIYYDKHVELIINNEQSKIDKERNESNTNG